MLTCSCCSRLPSTGSHTGFSPCHYEMHCLQIFHVGHHLLFLSHPSNNLDPIILQPHLYFHWLPYHISLSATHLFASSPWLDSIITYYSVSLACCVLIPLSFCLTHPARPQFNQVPASKQLNTAGSSSQALWRLTISCCANWRGLSTAQQALFYILDTVCSLSPVSQFLLSLQTSNNSSSYFQLELFVCLFAKKIETNQKG